MPLWLGYLSNITYISVVNSKLLYVLSPCVLLALWGLTGCKQPTESSNCTDENIAGHTKTLAGQILLENQTEHSNALIYISGLDRGASSDSSGYYSFQFDPCDTDTSGVFTLYYYLEDYDLDTAKIKLEHGWVQLDTLDVDSSGALPLVNMQQLYRLQGWTDKQAYHIGDFINYTFRWTNVSNEIVELFIGSAFNALGFVGLYRDARASKFGLTGSCDPVPLDIQKYLNPGEYYEGAAWGRIPSKQGCLAPYHPMVFTEYVVRPGFTVVPARVAGSLTWSRAISLDLDEYIWQEWEFLHRGTPPHYNNHPNNFELPHVQIVE